jgi:insertion element IS1 protein InsB
MNCRYCKTGTCVKNGWSGDKQRYKCRNCGKSQQAIYSYRACMPDINKWVISFVRESCGIRSIGRLLKISVTTVLRRIRQIASQLVQPKIALCKNYELDELRTYIGNKKKLFWVVSALQKETGQVVNFAVGRRTNKTLRVVVQTLQNSQCKSIVTDKLVNYRYLIPENLHQVKQFGTNHIERMHLNLRTHLKRLNRKTICCSKSMSMLVSCLKIYFWSERSI